MTLPEQNPKAYREKHCRLTKARWEGGQFDHLIKREDRVCKRDGCGNIFVAKRSDPKIYCSRSCAAKVNNRRRRKMSPKKASSKVRRIDLPTKEVKNLYYEEKLNSREIGEKLGVSQWRVIKFMKRCSLPRRTPAESNRIQFLRQKPSYRVRENLSSEEEKLKTVGLMLYWAEGAKRGFTVDFSNSDPEMIKLFLKFLRGICGVNEKRLRILLYCYANQNANNLKEYWSELTEIPIAQFSKPYVRKDFSKDKSGRMMHGLIHVRYSDKKLLGEIKKWVKEYSQGITS